VTGAQRKEIGQLNSLAQILNEDYYSVFLQRLKGILLRFNLESCFFNSMRTCRANFPNRDQNGNSHLIVFRLRYQVRSTEAGLADPSAMTTTR